MSADKWVVSAYETSVLSPDISMESEAQGLRPRGAGGIEMAGESTDVSSADTTQVERATKGDCSSPGGVPQGIQGVPSCVQQGFTHLTSGL